MRIVAIFCLLVPSVACSSVTEDAQCRLGVFVGLLTRIREKTETGRCAEGNEQPKTGRTRFVAIVKISLRCRHCDGRFSISNALGEGIKGAGGETCPAFWGCNTDNSSKTELPMTVAENCFLRKGFKVVCASSLFCAYSVSGYERIGCPHLSREF